MNGTLLDTIHSLERRAERLEKEAAALRDELTRVAHDLANPDAVVATYTIDGETLTLTQGEIEAVRSRLTRPRAEAVLHEVALAYKIASQSPGEDAEVEAERIVATMEAARAAAILDGTAIDDDEAAIDG